MNVIKSSIGSVIGKVDVFLKYNLIVFRRESNNKIPEAERISSDEAVKKIKESKSS